MIEFIWGCVSYAAAVLAGSWLVAWKLRRRTLFWLRSAVCLVLSCALLCGYDALITLAPSQSTLYFVLRMCDCLVVMLVAMASLQGCFECDIWSVLFCMTAGYCMQHISKTLCSIVVSGAGIQAVWQSGLLLVLISLVFYAAAYLFVIKRLDIRSITVDNAMLIMVTMVVLIASIFIYLVALRLAISLSATGMYILIQLFSMIIALLAFILQFGLLSNRRLRTERDTVRRLLDKENEQYRIDRERVEVINIKCHDIKQHLSLLRAMEDSEEKDRYIGELEQAVLFFENNVKTGNKTLDMLLAEKMLQCEKDKIVLSCIADGQALNFMAGPDIYSLFGNAVNNAIEGVRNIKEEQKRLITLKVSVKNSFLCILVENYFENELEFEEGLPQTTKSNREYHGFGLRSIRYTVEKYGGNLVVDARNNVFSLAIYIPLTK